MSTTPAPTAAQTNVTKAATHASFLLKLEGFFKKLGGEVETDLAKVFTSSTAKSIEASIKSVIETDLGQLALEAVTAATDIESKTINVKQAATSLVAAAKADGKTLASSTVDLLISMARQTLESKLGITTTTA